MKKRNKEKHRRIWKPVFFIVLALLAIEILLRIAGGLYLRSHFSQEQVNGGHTILALGESSTAGLWVAKGESYPEQLQEKLNEKVPGKNISVIVPLHLGQNTGQMSNRLAQYIRMYDPELIIIMAGYNNEWSLAESHIDRYLSCPENIRARILVFLDSLRIFRTARYFFLKAVLMDRSSYISGLEDSGYLLGGPELVRYPPEKEVYSFAASHKKEFIELWRDDMKSMIDKARADGIPVVLMTYHINPSYLDADEFVKLSDEENITLVRNDILFRQLAESGEISRYVFPADRWHPNADGYRLIAENAAEAIIRQELI
ncbi:hypothetical protein JXC34_06135 [Candidatus Woesearchaeota archaeon]|nr:hypothetical protein [Candidatus Woesearchaeota archaeon]